jgi:HEAT repeat protein
MLRDAAARTLGMLGDASSVKPLIHVLNAIDTPTELIAQALAAIYTRYETLWSNGSSIVGSCRDFIRPSGVQNLIDALANVETENVRPWCCSLDG